MAIVQHAERAIGGDTLRDCGNLAMQYALAAVAGMIGIHIDDLIGDLLCRQGGQDSQSHQGKDRSGRAHARENAAPPLTQALRDSVKSV
ncbi:uncharacterized protein PY1_contig-01-59 [Novosphingobium sp. PY1]|nr:uncharacterized protein PY1_contig-01-59 [Novosphingobium sp. PY1]